MLAPISIMVAGIVFSSVIALYACNKAALGTDPGKASFKGGARSLRLHDYKRLYRSTTIQGRRARCSLWVVGC